MIIQAKILYQSLWLHGTGWDDPVPPAIKTKYETLRSTLPCLEEVKLPRWTNASKSTALELHGFSDASEKAYAACIYLRVKDGDKYHCHLLASKTRVAPLKTVSIPRLELMGAVLLTQLIQHTKAALRKPDIPIYGWTDSTITLCWIKSHPGKFKTFVENRISAIQEVLPPEHWHHVPTKQNPADHASRGVMPNELKALTIWFNGPAFLHQVSTLSPLLLQWKRQQKK